MSILAFLMICGGMGLLLFGVFSGSNKIAGLTRVMYGDILMGSGNALNAIIGFSDGRTGFAVLSLFLAGMMALLARSAYLRRENLKNQDPTE